MPGRFHEMKPWLRSKISMVSAPDIAGGFVEKTVVLKTRGMHCASCEKLIEGALMGVKGVRYAKSDYANGRTEVRYEDSETGEKEITEVIRKEGYGAEHSAGYEGKGAGQGDAGSKGPGFGTLSIILGFVAILIGLYLLLGRAVSLDFSGISENTGIAVLLATGFLAGFHCVGMCGGFVLSYTARIRKQGDLMPHLQYGAGKTASYTILGALFGRLGSFIAFTSELRGYIGVVAGLFLVLYGINMLNVLPQLRKFQPRLPSFMPQVEFAGRGPLVIGLLNGLLLACGPLMALYIFAAGTGSPVAGAKALFFFGLGTLVPMLTFGVVSHYLSAAFLGRMVRFSGVLVMVLGLLMAGNGLALLGVALPVRAPVPVAIGAAGVGNQSAVAAPSAGNNIKVDADGYQVINMNVTGRGFEPNSFVLKKGVPVRWVIDAQDLNGCNNEILVREYGLDIRLKPGLQAAEFTPDKAGTVGWSCWMGMLRGQFVVVDAGTDASKVAAPQLPAGGGCGCGG